MGTRRRRQRDADEERGDEGDDEARAALAGAARRRDDVVEDIGAGPRRRESGEGLEAEEAGDHEPLHLVGALADLEDLLVAVET